MKYTQLVLEDIPMLFIDVLIFSKILRVPRVAKVNMDSKTLGMQFLTTVLSIYKASSSLKSESKGFKEGAFMSFLRSLKAKQDWVPFADQLESRKLLNDIDFGNLTLRKGSFILGSDSLNNYANI